jgi:predicted phage tail protein
MQHSDSQLQSHASRIISRILSPAVRLWLRSQVEQVEDLQFQIEGGDRQILSGHIPRVAIAARQVVYQGLHLSQMDLAGTGIRINLGQVLKGKPLKLLEIVPVEGEMQLQEADLNASLRAPILSGAVSELLVNQPNLLRLKKKLPSRIYKCKFSPIRSR